MIRTLLVWILPVVLWAQSATEVVFDSASQAAVISDALKAYYAIEGDFSATPAGMELKPLGVLPDKVEVAEAPEKPQQMMLVRVKFIKDGSVVGAVAGTVRASWMVEALISSRSLQRKQIPSAEDFEIKPIDRLASKAVPVEPTINLADYEMLSNLQAGATLTWNSIHAKPLVRKGDTVDVLAQEGALKISSKAVAMQDGGRHQQIIVRNTTTNRQYQAEVINENLVTVRF